MSGRKLVGLRYWNTTSESGENEWRFECRDEAGMALLVPDEKYLFWLTLTLTVRDCALLLLLHIDSRGVALPAAVLGNLRVCRAPLGAPGLLHALRGAWVHPSAPPARADLRCMLP